MKSKFKLVYIVCIISIQLNLIGCKKDKRDMTDGNVRPSDFPINIFPIADAFDISYADSNNNKIMKGCYRMSYVVKDNFPCAQTIKQIQKDMESKEFVKVEWSKEDFSVYKKNSVGPSDVYQEQKGGAILSQEGLEDECDTNTINVTSWKKAVIPNESQEDKGYIWKEEWISPKDDLVTIILNYKDTDDTIGGKLYVQYFVCTPASARYKEILKYKELHPEKFSNK